MGANTAGNDGDLILFVEPHYTGEEGERLAEAIRNIRIAGDNVFSRICHIWLKKLLGVEAALLTTSGTAALDMAALLCDLEPGDEVIMPSYTFTSTANAVVLRRGVPVFVDIRPDTLNLDEKLIEAAITPRTKAILPVHYAGVPCEMDTINAVASRHNLLVVEDAAQALMSQYKGRPAGTLGDMAAFSFHETKNIHTGEGGAFVTTSTEIGHRAEIVREKGTNRSAFFRGEVDKYTWVDIGSSFLANELTAAFLAGQLSHAASITAARRAIWDRYYNSFEELERQGFVTRPVIPPDCEHNAHIFYLLVGEGVNRGAFIRGMRERKVQLTFHYVPLHSSPAGQRYCRTEGALTATDDCAASLVRLPLWPALGPRVDQVIERIYDYFATLR
jgi:dTDP-4-amino-4,6-dideoxygalactose transaminase